MSRPTSVESPASTALPHLPRVADLMSLGKNKPMKICYLVLVILVAAGCAQNTESTSKFTLTTTVPADLADARREAWQVERMVESARFHEIAFGGDARFSATKVHLRVDRSKTRIEVSLSDSSKEISLQAARVFADAAARVIEFERAEFGINPLLNVAVGPVDVTLF